VSRSTKYSNHSETDKAYTALKRRILAGQITAGPYLDAAAMSRELGVGRTPFREACHRLRQERFLEIVPRHGYFVPELTFHAARDLLELRLVIEGVVAELAAVRARPDQLDELGRLAKAITSLSGKPEAFEKLVKGNTEFHLCLARMTQNKELVHLAQNCLERTERFMYIELQYARFPMTDLDEYHKPIVQAIRDRDPAAARRAVEDDVGHSQTLILGADLLARNRKPF